MSRTRGSFFGPRDELARAHPSYEHRPGQQAMAGAVADVLKTGGNIMIEAGTGTGKTLAYLVPALSAGRRVIISTGTRNLQDQIWNHDLPFLRDDAGIRFTACVMKGRDNYLCRYRMAQFEREPLLTDLTEQPWLGRIAEWTHRTASGDRAEIAELPDRLKLWRDINARADTCGGSKCPEYEDCWLTRLKRRAGESQVVVVNHHLFFADLAVRTAYGAVLPDYDTVIFDEAHMVEEVATLYFGLQSSANQFEELARGVEKLSAKNNGPGRGGGGAAGLRSAAFEFFEPLLAELQRVPGRTRFETAERGGLDLEAEWAVMCEALDEVVRQAYRLGATEEGADTIPQRAADLRDTLGSILKRDDPSFVYGAELRGRGNVVLSAVPIDVAAPLKAGLFDELHACVLTSATLAVDGSFDFFQKRLGLQDARTLVVESSFDYPRQAALYLPRSLPEPRDPRFVDSATAEIRRLLRITDGRAFLLFTSYANLNRVHAALEATGDWPLIRQGDGSKVALVERFKTTHRAVLLGTTSFWHGVDVPGAALSMVVVDKLPFDVPSDPLVAARIERVRGEGGEPFREYQTPLAVLELKQGLGRLIRSRQDRGILAVLDSRLTGRSYGKTFLRSLPPYQIVRDFDDLAEFFADGGDETPEPGDPK